MRNLSQNSAAQKNSTASAPVTIIAVDWGGEAGTRYYADRTLGGGDASSALNAEERIVGWSGIRNAYREDASNPVGDCRVKLRDDDGVLKACVDAAEPQRRAVTVYQHFTGLTADDLTVVMRGIVNAPVTWAEDAATLSFDITDVSTLYDRKVGTVADRVDLPFIAAEDEGRVVPVVYGRGVRRVRAVSVLGGRVTHLVRRAGATDTMLYVQDAEHFPQNDTVRIRIDDEVLLGFFRGNTFYVQQRGADLVQSQVTASRDSTSFYDRTLPSRDDYCRGYWLQVTNPSAQTQQYYITAYSGDTGCVVYLPQTTDAGAAWTMPAGSSYSIASWARSHDAGARVFLHGAEYKFIANDAASAAVRVVEGLGRTSEWKDYPDLTPPVSIKLNHEGWFTIDASLYTVDRNDTSVYGAGHPVTSVSFLRHPAEYYPGMEDVNVYTTLDGVDANGDGTGAALADPADVILDLLQQRLGAPAGDIDAASFAAAKSDGTEHISFGFVIEEEKDGLQLAADLAFQARCALLWEDGAAKLVFLRDRLGSPAQTLDATKVALDSIAVRRTTLDDLVNEVRADFRERGGDGDARRQAVIVADAASQAQYGRRARAIDLWAHNNRGHAAAVAGYWLQRWKDVRERVELVTYLTSLELQRCDVVTLDGPLFVDGQKGRVVEVVHTPGSGTAARMDVIGLTLELPRWAGCAGTCETACEGGAESGCYTACESSAQSCWQCETACEDACELANTTQACVRCISYDTGCGAAACESACQAACESACESGCEIGCESSCETGAEVVHAPLNVGAGLDAPLAAIPVDITGTHPGATAYNVDIVLTGGASEAVSLTAPAVYQGIGAFDFWRRTTWDDQGQPVVVTEQDGQRTLAFDFTQTTEAVAWYTALCGTTCQVACESACESGCELACQSACESACETACEVACETGCEVACETACEVACQASCETACETGCEISAEGSCSGVQNFTSGYTGIGACYSIDSASSISVSVTRVEVCYLYRDCGAGVLADFVHQFKTTMTGNTGQNGDIGMFWNVSNVLTNAYAAEIYDYEMVSLYWYISSGAPVTSIRLADWNSNSYDLSTLLTIDTPYYLTVTHDSEFGAITVEIFDDAARTNLIDTLVVYTYTPAWQYLMPVESFNSGQTGRRMDFTVEDYDT